MNDLNTRSIAKNYTFLAIMLASMVLGCVVGWAWPGAKALKPLGTVFINMMFCIVVPLVFASISSAVANMQNRRRAGRIMGTTIAVFVVTGAIAAVIMFILVQIFPPVLVPWTELPSQDIGDYASMAELVVNFFTAEDFVGLLSRRAMLPLIVFSLLFGFSVNLTGGKSSPIGKLLEELTRVMLQFVKLVTYYAPIAFFAIFADLVATYGPQITTHYVRALLLFYPLCFVYIVTAWPLFAWFGGGKGAIQVMFRHIAKPAVVSLGTCSSVATIPTNMDAAESTGISRDVSDIVLPMGATMHMDGSCFSCVLKIAFVLGVFGQSMGFDKLIPVVLVAVLSSVGMSGVPGGGYIGEYIIGTIFFPDQMAIAFPILVAIGNLVDPPATMINAAGDYVVSFLVSRFVDGKDWLRNATIRRSEGRT